MNRSERENYRHKLTSENMKGPPYRRHVGHRSSTLSSICFKCDWKNWGTLPMNPRLSHRLILEHNYDSQDTLLEVHQLSQKLFEGR
jgi:hypothetical protein